ncbi:MAG: ribosome small subunit-dependent GTPase A [Spirochaetaceae bacterium]|nr:ribosome small subunit-dependent GTPase A [Spirochaetaceae bacterium]|tara:strand:+ start:11890 stop:13026 length:1137 start_codon:yes stop_codon:yes gene_type:complete
METNSEIQCIVTAHYGSEYGIVSLTEADGSGRLRERPDPGPELRALLPGRFQMLPALDPADLMEGGDVLPAVGDMIRCRPIDRDQVLVESVFPRRSLLHRKQAGGSDSQIMAANVDLVWIVMPADRPLSDGGCLRYLNVAGGVPVRIAITKCDLIPNERELQDIVDRLSRLVSAANIHLLSMTDPDSIQSVRSILRTLETTGQAGPPVALTCFLGPSGAGKSTLVNALLGRQTQDVSHVSESTGKGRHTTTRRDWILHPDGYGILDTPGMRELGLDALPEEGPFGYIQELATNCRFRDCKHEQEQGCAVQEAVRNGDLNPSLLESYKAMHAEVQRLQEFRKKRKKPVADEGKAAQRDAKEKWHKEITMKIRKGPKKRN